MRLLVDTSQVSFTVSQEAAPKTDQNGVQRTDRRTKELLFTVQLVAMDESGAEVIRVTVAGTPPKVTKGQAVKPAGLEALPWAQNGRNGVAYRATEITALSGSKAAATSS